ncbi:hypothetical protein AG4045_014590 [Apium graveolens]|uniref:ATP-dependent RNA helicase n=1 Tax=Apium graveolens TaxID=4045 RepID=A0A6L5BFK4_APIGR|nr:hypothetical protein AG4045_014590 [Apium graveolens]
MAGCISEESQMDSNMTDFSPGNDGEEIFKSDDEVYDSLEATELQEKLLGDMAGAAPEDSEFDERLYDLKMSKLLEADGEEFFTSYEEVYDSFDAMGLETNLLRGIYAYGFEKPSAIQQQGIVPFCKGLDVIQQAQSGTGKTAVFCSGVLQQLDYNVVECQALVLAPNRELAQQINKVMRALGDYLGVKVHACVDGISIREDQRILSSGVHVVVGTLGRVSNMLRRKTLSSDYIRMFVLDEADEMLLKEFKKIHDILQLIPPEVQCQALVLAPTCELAQQIEMVMQALGDYVSVRVHACGQASIRKDQHVLSRRFHVVVGTPSRVFHLLQRRSLYSDYIKMLVLDEVDKMHSRDYREV